ncbi:uncharacterized protein LOC113229587 isoform X2 [Hyposmocoma kahamanoa]|uniref:uncharacterized protein LOC113229587 isoform X2 n=1 Tax=Hyposmocoma kahamanoa TaxID=1477025 RepID=UPI000E6D70A2|nr:uncharacterized protein LOC113229587 isoform X2 [Hyposmocoma kahamanoa]
MLVCRGPPYKDSIASRSAHTIGGAVKVKHSHVNADFARMRTRSLCNREELMNHSSGKESRIVRTYGMTSVCFLSSRSSNKGLRLEARSKSQSPSKIPVRPGAHTRSKTLSFLHPYNNNADIISDTSSRRTSYKGTSDNTSKCSTLTVIENGYGSPLVLPIHRRLTLRREGGKVGSNAVSVSNAKQSLVNVKAPPILLKPRGKTS